VYSCRLRGQGLPDEGVARGRKIFILLEPQRFLRRICRAREPPWRSNLIGTRISATNQKGDMVSPGDRDLILVTGASGFVGSAIANASRVASYRVLVLVRGSSPRTNIPRDEEAILADLLDHPSLLAALPGVRYL